VPYLYGTVGRLALPPRLPGWAACPPRRIQYPVQSERDFPMLGLCHDGSLNPATNRHTYLYRSSLRASTPHDTLTTYEDIKL
jgi:hypothetical protein